MPLVEHVKELRRRLTWCLLALGIGITLTFIYWEPVYSVLREPYCRIDPPQGCKLYAYGIFDQFNTKLRVALIGGTVLTAPVWLYQLGAFITPALHKRERRYAAGFLAAALVLFASGVVVAYYSLSFGLHVLLSAAGGNVQVQPALKDYLSFLTLILVLFGLAFEFPVVIVFLNVVGVLSADRMRAWRRGMFFGILAAAAILTPSTDPFQFLALGIPLYIMYEVCIIIARVRERAGRRRQARKARVEVPDDEASELDSIGDSADDRAL